VRLEEAAVLLEQARETFEELRARPWLERAEAAASQARVPADESASQRGVAGADGTETALM